MLEHSRDAELTVVSLSDEMPAPPERRQSQRNLSVLRTAVLRTSCGEELCLVRNISAGGLMAHVYSRLSRGDPATIAFKSEVAVRGHVVWSRDRLVGIQFTQPIDVSEVLADHHDTAVKAYQPRLPRVDVHTAARLRSGGQYQPIVLCNISQGGAKLHLGRPEQLKTDVVLIANGLPRLPGTVRWRRGDYAGVSFNEVIPFADVARWVANAHRHAH
jgi:hypothetical protein